MQIYWYSFLHASALGDLSNELVRHFLIECTQKGVRLKGCPNEPYFGENKWTRVWLIYCLIVILHNVFNSISWYWHKDIWKSWYCTFPKKWLMNKRLFSCMWSYHPSVFRVKLCQVENANWNQNNQISAHRSKMNNEIVVVLIVGRTHCVAAPGVKYNVKRWKFECSLKCCFGKSENSIIALHWSQARTAVLLYI